MMNDELLTTYLPAPVANAIQDVIDIAGTSDASWAVLKAAGELINRERNRADVMRDLRESDHREIQDVLENGHDQWECQNRLRQIVGEPLRKRD